MTKSTFRVFCQAMWYAHVEEHEAWMGFLPTYSSDVYFNRHKWMLKSLYKSCGGDLTFLTKLG